MRLKIATLALLTAATGGAQASSFAHVAPPTGKPASIIAIGLPKMAGKPAAARPAAGDGMLVPLAYPLPKARAVPAKFVAVSRSVVALETAEPPVTFETVAAVPRSHPAPQPKPLVIRGGIAGDAFSGRAEPVALPPAGDGKADSGRQRKREQCKEREAPQQPAPQAPAPAMSPRQFAVPG